MALTCKTLTMQVANPVVVPRPEPLQLIRSAIQSAVDIFDDAVMPQERVRTLLRWAAWARAGSSGLLHASFHHRHGPDLMHPFSAGRLARLRSHGRQHGSFCISQHEDVRSVLVGLLHHICNLRLAGPSSTTPLVHAGTFTTPQDCTLFWSHSGMATSRRSFCVLCVRDKHPAFESKQTNVTFYA